MIIKNLLLVYNSRLLSSPISSFGELCDYGARIEDAINNGQLEKGKSKPSIKKAYGGGATTSKAPSECKCHHTSTNLNLPKLHKKGRPRIFRPRNDPCLCI